MVIITCKKSDTEQFYYECKTNDSNDKVVRELCAIQNLREKVNRLAGAIEELAKHGISKPEAEKGLDEIQDKVAALSMSGSNASSKLQIRNDYYCPDPIGHRTGNAPAPNLQEVLRRTAADGLALTSKELFASGTALTASALLERIDNIRGAVSIAFPEGLPENDPVRLLLEDSSDDGFLHDLMGNEFMEAESASLWWAGKEFFRDQTVGDRVGKNEKTKVIARLQKKGAGAPMREPVISEDERKAMMAAYFKKQEEEKALADNDDDSFLNSSWADPKALKRNLQGATGINYRPGK